MPLARILRGLGTQPGGALPAVPPGHFPASVWMLRYWPGALDLARRAFSVRILFDFPVAP
jgi:hypothetical protein